MAVVFHCLLPIRLKAGCSPRHFQGQSAHPVALYVVAAKQVGVLDARLRAYETFLIGQPSLLCSNSSAPHLCSRRSEASGCAGRSAASGGAGAASRFGGRCRLRSIRRTGSSCAAPAGLGGEALLKPSLNEAAAADSLNMCLLPVAAEGDSNGNRRHSNSPSACILQMHNPFPG